MSVSPPKLGRFTLKCPHCENGFVLKLLVTTAADEKAEKKKEQTFTGLAKRNKELEQSLAEMASRPKDAATDSFATLPSVGGNADQRREATDPDSTSARSFSPLVDEHTEATGGYIPRPGQDEQTQAVAHRSNAANDTEADPNFPGYEVLKVLGKGGMGSVFLARQQSLDRTVALKTMNAEWAADVSFVSRFVREAYAAAQLTHHNVVQIYELGQDRGRNFFSMELVRGGSLGDLLRKSGKLAAAEAVGYVLQAASGLRYAHDRGMVHRDIKPDNLMLNDEGIVKVADLGLVKTRGMTAADDANGNTSAAGLSSLPDITRVGSAMGSPTYMAPEQARNAAGVDHRADIYSLGCSLYVLLAGRGPFIGKTAVEVITKHLEEPPPPLRRMAPDIPADLATVVDRTLAKDPAARFQSMTEFAAALKGWLAKLAGGTKPTEAQLLAFEGAVKQLANEPLAGIASKVAFIGPLLGLLLGVGLLFVSPQVGGAVLVATLAAVASGFVTAGLLTGSPLFAKVREWVFGARFVDWLTAGLAMVLFVLVLFFTGLLWAGLGGLLLGAAVGVGYGYGLAKPAHAKALETKDELESLGKRWRLAGMDEDEVRAFVVQNSGDRWERVFELLYGYPAKLLARTQYAEQVASKPKWAGWRDGLIARLNAALDNRRQAKARAVLKKAETARLKSQGVTAAEAAALAEDAADDVVEQGKEIQAANADAKKKVNVRAMMSRYEQAKSIPRKPRPPFALVLLRRLLGVPFSPRLWLVAGAGVVVFGLLWVNQRTAGAVEGLKDGADAGGLWQKVQPLALTPGQKPLALDWLPKEVGGLFDTLNPILAGLLLVLSAFASNTLGRLVTIFGAAVVFLGHHTLKWFGVALPEMGPVQPSHLTAGVGLLIGVVGFWLLRWKRTG